LLCPPHRIDLDLFLILPLLSLLAHSSPLNVSTSFGAQLFLPFSVQSSRIMTNQYTPPPDDPYESPQPHPYLHEPLLYISGLPHFVTDENLALAFTTCAPFRPRITRDGTTNPLSGIIEFRVLDKGVPPLHHYFSYLSAD